MRSWRAVLADPRLRAVAEEQGLRIVFMPRPNLMPYLEAWEPDPCVEVLSYSTADLQTGLASAGVT
ncbi:hypothetical protein [Sanguibacter sp. HDW7]|uniref:hypothetical protein n=1 Tax=Sanguibacter sp. HDW7 TaxID=2714931 RepID=UPI001409AF63|nr:hypothetical protein [Sanguibacter sp. HDW7]QIK82872.1 hypothetical protein G7063_03955 [Sanguibacter sp. HDW7]